MTKVLIFGNVNVKFATRSAVKFKKGPSTS